MVRIMSGMDLKNPLSHHPWNNPHILLILRQLPQHTFWMNGDIPLLDQLLLHVSQDTCPVIIKFVGTLVACLSSLGVNEALVGIMVASIVVGLFSSALVFRQVNTFEIFGVGLFRLD
jgi:hypothetical protein